MPQESTRNNYQSTLEDEPGNPCARLLSSKDGSKSLIDERTRSSSLAGYRNIRTQYGSLRPDLSTVISRRRGKCNSCKQILSQQSRLAYLIICYKP